MSADKEGWIISFADWAASHAEEEVSEAGGGVLQTYAGMKALVEMPRGWNESHRPIFIRHRFPISVIVPSQSSATEIISESINQVTSASAAWESTWSLQIQMLGQVTVDRREIAEKITDSLSSRGIQMDRKSGTRILSIACSGEQVFIGISSRSDNLSPWAGGEARYRQDESMISRSEMKLLEARDVFDLPLDGQGALALDLGAAPGGWSRILTTWGFRVAAVDPGRLDDRLSGDERISYYRLSAEEYIDSPSLPTVSLIVNDMKLDGDRSSSLMVHAGKSLLQGGLALMTIKLDGAAQSHPWAILDRSFEILGSIFEVVETRHLFHNRHEVTVLLRKK